MWLRARSILLVGLFVHLQLSVWAEKLPEDYYEGNEGIFELQKCVERLIEKILSFVEDLYTKIRHRCKCIPEEVPDTIIEILKRSIDCVGDNEKKLQDPRTTKTVARKIFHGCLSHGKKEVEDLINGINPDLNHCPENMTEKMYQINITTSLMKIFNINIKNGLEITHRITYLTNHTLPDDEDDDDEEEEEESEEESDTEEFDDDEYSDYDRYGKSYEEGEYVYDEPDRKVNSKIAKVQANKKKSDKSRKQFRNTQ